MLYSPGMKHVPNPSPILGGNRTLVEDSLGFVETSHYNALNELDSRWLSQGGQFLMHEELTYDGDGQILTQHSYSSGSPAEETSTSA
jgi:hypothetical protein